MVSRIVEKFYPAVIALSVISLAELYDGIYYSKNSSQHLRLLQDFLPNVEILGITHDICKIFGKECGKLRLNSTPIPDFDLLIASTCLHHGLILLSNNRKHYEMIDNLEIISIPS